MQNITEVQETYEQCFVEMPKRFITGSVNGQFIGSMKKLAQEIIPFALNNQFQEPKITNSISLELDHTDEDEFNTNQNIEHSIDSTYTSRPSDFRIKSICKTMTSEYVEHHEQHYSLDRNDIIGSNHTNDETTQNDSPKSIRKLFDDFITDFNASVERYCENAIAYNDIGLVFSFLIFHWNLE